MEENEEWNPEPTLKSEAINSTIISLTGIDRRESINNKLCGWCNSPVTMDSFKDEISLKEYRISGLCQDCQDRMWPSTN